MNTRSNENYENIKEIVELLRIIVHNPRIEKVPEEWLDALDVMNYLRIGSSTFYRLRKSENWKSKKIGNKPHYLKSSINGETQY